ncbi:MAG: OsmC family protein [bacterium]
MAEKVKTTGKASWIQGLQFTATTHSGKEVVLDSPKKELGGLDSGPSPAELIPIALAGCTGMDVISILQKMQQDVKGFSVAVEAEREPEHPRRYTSLEVTYHFNGEDLDPAKVEKAIILSRDKYCSVQATLEPVAPSRHFYTIDGGDPVPLPVTEAEPGAGAERL